MPDYFNGTDFVVQLGDAGDPEQFTTVACQRSTSSTQAVEAIDVSSKCNAPHRTSIEGGQRSMSLSMSGVITSEQSIVDLVSIAHNGSIRNYRLYARGGADVYEGPFLLTSFNRDGEYTDAEVYDISLESAGHVLLNGA